MSKYKNRIIAVTVIAVILIVSFVFGGNIPKETTPAATQAPTASPVPVMEQIPAPTPEIGASDGSSEKGESSDSGDDSPTYGGEGGLVVEFDASDDSVSSPDDSDTGSEVGGDGEVDIGIGVKAIFSNHFAIGEFIGKFFGKIVDLSKIRCSVKVPDLAGKHVVKETEDNEDDSYGKKIEKKEKNQRKGSFFCHTAPFFFGKIQNFCTRKLMGKQRTCAIISESNSFTPREKKRMPRK